MVFKTGVSSTSASGHCSMITAKSGRGGLFNHRSLAATTDMVLQEQGDDQALPQWSCLPFGCSSCPRHCKAHISHLVRRRWVLKFLGAERKETAGSSTSSCYSRASSGLCSGRTLRPSETGLLSFWTPKTRRAAVFQLSRLPRGKGQQQTAQRQRRVPVRIGSEPDSNQG